VIDAARVGVCVGTTVGCAFDAEAYYRACLGGLRPSPEALAAYLSNDLATVLGLAAGARGPLATVVNACASSADAIGLARRWLLARECDVVICGGADALHRFPFLGFGVLKNTSSGPCRPFDASRSGLNLGDGAGLLVLERETDALARGARVLGFVSGYATTADAHHLTAPHPEGLGLRLALERALADARIEPSAVGFVHAHGTGTTHNDRVEGRALADRFGTGVVVFSTKGYTGHTLGAAGALGAIFSLAHLRLGRVPACAGFETPDPECLVVPTRRACAVDADAAVACSLAFGGTNSVLVFERAPAATEAKP
jgi:3-oxoacyl-[acyl-carrier-protein] synthase-1/3-oxoacyl-[acyl-carrier-protein] synthase II